VRWVALLANNYFSFVVYGDKCSHQLLPLLYLISGSAIRGVEIKL
jgi:hypothetical protein